jgi:hypothetical protein
MEARVRTHDNIAHRLGRGIRDASRGWTTVTEQTVAAGLLGLPQPEDRLGEWQRVWVRLWDEIEDMHLELGVKATQPTPTQHRDGSGPTPEW